MHKKLVLIGALALFCFGIPKISAQEAEVVILNEEAEIVTVEENVIPLAEEAPVDQTPVIVTPVEEEATISSDEEVVIVVEVPANEESINTEGNVTPGEDNTAPVDTGDNTIIIPLSAQALVTSGVLAATAFMLV